MSSVQLWMGIFFIAYGSNLFSKVMFKIFSDTTSTAAPATKEDPASKPVHPGDEWESGN
ncbi:hypothetical protein [Levilactobacillus suantsaii]|uniref:hypothetical protein n=1 Tax=Levilactobacillus suantsaii TaxID=2292255 RepID=UPI0014837C7D|nr:hypothetical protein [Levilactobacillus suantsaii]QMU08633.1 hypothetical protein H3M12_02925 [Levilactobacillus suantsaii]